MVAIVFLVLSTIWGSTWLVIKIGLEDLPPFWFATGRFIIALIPLSLLLIYRRRPLPRKKSDWMIIGITGFLIFGMNYALVFWGEKYISSGLAAILYTLLPLFGIVISHFYRRLETFTLRKMAGVVFGILGVSIIFRHHLKLDDSTAIWGCLALLIAALGTAFGGILLKAHGTHLDTITLTTGQVFTGLIPLVLLAWFLEPFPDLASLPSRSWYGMAYLGLFGSALTFVLINWLIKRIAVTTTQLIPLASTLLAVWLGATILDEPLQPGTTIGGGLVLSGLLLATLTTSRNNKPASQPTLENTNRPADK